MDYLITYGIAILLLVLCIWWNWDVVKLNSHSLHLQWLFWIAVIFPILSCVYFGSIIWYEYPLELSKNGYNGFLEISKLPFYLLAGSPILGAFIVSAHRSYQTDIQIKTAKEQLDEAQKKNKIDIYHSKKKFLIEEISSLRTKNDEKIEQVNQLYYKIFFISDNYNDVINTVFFIELDNMIKSFNQKLDTLLNEKHIESFKIFHKVRNKKIQIDTPPRGYSSERVVKDISSGSNDVENSYISNLSLDYDKIKKHMRVGIYSTILHSYLEILAPKSNIFKTEMQIYNYFISELITEVQSTFDLIKMISLFTLENKNIYETLPALNKGYELLDGM